MIINPDALYNINKGMLIKTYELNFSGIFFRFLYVGGPFLKRCCQGCIKQVSAVSWIQDRLVFMRQLPFKRTILQAWSKAQLVLHKIEDRRHQDIIHKI